ncbi:hypothetical protein BEH_25080 (plasmid) [Priestia filamentosa]|uniref:Uncharacterized protein n=1 Tax=Priestia filamentosa TaxID=1402861 RepID=A0A2S1LZM1_9BACI|nr:hypothetical protein BEH_25080 [Priestia filamentosa]
MKAANSTMYEILHKQEKKRSSKTLGGQGFWNLSTSSKIDYVNYKCIGYTTYKTEKPTDPEQ